MSKYSTIHILVATLWLLNLFGCSTEVDKDIINYVNNVKNTPKRSVPNLPEIYQFTSQVYSANAARSPFKLIDLSNLATKEKNIQSSPDINRPREFLESFDLNDLKMVGTITNKKNSSGLLLDRSGLLHRVSIGDHIGFHSGRIEEILENHMEISELHQDRDNNWQRVSKRINISK